MTVGSGMPEIVAELSWLNCSTAAAVASRSTVTTEDSGTVVVPLVPWSIAGVFMAGTLGVETLSYAPWAVMCWSGVLFAVLWGFAGIGIAERIQLEDAVISAMGGGVH